MHSKILKIYTFLQNIKNQLKFMWTITSNTIYVAKDKGTGICILTIIALRQ